MVVDTPGTDSYLTRLAHSMADTLITPLNDSFVDFDVLGTVDATTFAVTGESHYAEMVRDARRQRRLIDGTRMDWVVVRNRLSMLGSRNKRLIGEGMSELAARLGFRCADGLAERVIYREFFPRGLSALDNLDEATLGTRPSLAHVTARDEVMSLIATLKLPLDARGQRRVVRGAAKPARGPRPDRGVSGPGTRARRHCAGGRLWPPYGRWKAAHLRALSLPTTAPTKLRPTAATRRRRHRRRRAPTSKPSSPK